MKSNAQREASNDAFERQQNLYAPNSGVTGTDGGSALKQMAAERLAAHRKRRATVEVRDGRQVQHDAASTKSPRITAAAQKVRDAVAARYRQTPSFREYLAAEAEEAVQKTRADVEVAARAAKAVADVQMQLMAELEQWPEESLAAEVLQASSTSAAEEEPFAWASGAVKTPAAKSAEFELEGPELRVRHYEALPQPTPPPAAKEIPEWVAQAAEAYHAEELQDLNEEIEFRLSPEFNEHLLEPLTIQANIIEFPRQLVAARKARPRLAEGPLRAEAESVAERPAEFQMRIFEVDPGQISVTPAEETVQPEAPEWQSLMLGRSEAPALPPAHEVASASAEVAGRTLVHREAHAHVELRVASAELRMMSAIVDAACVSGAGLLFVTVAAWMSNASVKDVPLPLLGAFAGALLVVLFVMYQGLFFWLGEATPGMHYANLVFRSLEDGEPSRAAMRKRVGANLLAAAPLGLGLMWSLVDGDKLGWNDRMSGLYLREF
jgi:hypothetical protein